MTTDRLYTPTNRRELDAAVAELESELAALQQQRARCGNKQRKQHLTYEIEDAALRLDEMLRRFYNAAWRHAHPRG